MAIGNVIKSHEEFYESPEMSTIRNSNKNIAKERILSDVEFLIRYVIKKVDLIKLNP